MKKIKIGLIGLGFMGKTHFDIYRGLPGVEVVAISDIDPRKRSGDVSGVTGNIGDGGEKKINIENVAVYDDGFALIREADTDIIDICVPTPFHKDYIIAALGAGRHVFSEKPLCRNLDHLEEISHAVKKNGKFFNVGMCVRAWPEYYYTKELLDSGRIGRVRSAVFRRLSPSVDGNSWENWFSREEMSGGALLDLHLHDTDVICFFFGRPQAVSSFGARGITGDTGVDHVITNYVYDCDMLVSAEGGWGAAKNVAFEMSFRIISEKATVIFDHNGYKIYHNNGEIESPEISDPLLPTGWHRELDYFVKCVRENVVPDKYQTFESIADAFRVVMAELESIETKELKAVKYV